MEEKKQITIPTSKVQRAGKMFSAGLKVGGNYLKYYSEKIIKGDADRSALDEANAQDIYDSLSELKGSALKAAQMISMDHNMLPPAFAEKFRMAQYKAPPLSYPLVVQTFKKSLGKKPEHLFDSFSHNAVNAASIGQVHRATKKGKIFAVKIQYPGVAASVEQDLRIAMPLAAKIMNVKQKDLKQYMDEVKQKMLEETDYALELERSMKIAQACQNLPGIIFPNYYAQLSGPRVITMDWIDGLHIADWIATNPSLTDRQAIGQRLWDFYHFQIHELKLVHADPHPGNFLVTPQKDLAVIDFGCVKEIPDPFYQPFFELLQAGSTSDKKKCMELFHELEFILPTDTADEIDFFYNLLTQAVELLTKPFEKEVFDFSDVNYFNSIYRMADQLMRDPQLRRNNGARGSRHSIYIYRTYFGLYTLLHQLKAKVKTRLPVQVT